MTNNYLIQGFYRPFCHPITEQQRTITYQMKSKVNSTGTIIYYLLPINFF